MSHVCIFRSRQSLKHSRNFLSFMVHYLFTRALPCTLSTLLNTFHINCPGIPSVPRSPSVLFEWVPAAVLCAFHILHSLPILSSLIWSFLVLYVDEQKLWHFSICSFIYPPVSFSFWDLISSSTSCFHMCRVCSSLLKRIKWTWHAFHRPKSWI